MKYSALKDNDGEVIYNDDFCNLYIIFNCNIGFEYMRTLNLQNGNMYIVSLHPIEKIELDIPQEDAFYTELPDDHKEHILSIINNVYGGYIQFLKAIQARYDIHNQESYYHIYSEYGKDDIISAMGVKEGDIPIL